MLIAVCLSFSDRRPEVDPLTGEVATDERTSRLTDADARRAGARTAVRGGLGRRRSLAVTVGPAAAEVVLREALACGAARAVRVDAAVGPARPRTWPPHWRARSRDADQVWCGDQGLEPGSGAVPVFLATLLGRGGCVRARRGRARPTGPRRAGWRCVRRLDGGRRERLAVDGRAVLSVEGATARLRRAGLPGVLRAERATIEVVRRRRRCDGRRRRARRAAGAVPAPASGGAGTGRGHGARPGAGRSPARGWRRPGPTPSDGRPVTTDPEEAADRILAALDRWGYELPERAAP